MRKLSLLPSVSLFFVAILALTAPAVGDQSRPLPVAESQKRVVSITESGLEPPLAKLTQLDGSVFFVNRTEASLLSIEIDFGKNHMHCASENIKLDGEGKLSTVVPIAPLDFALTCFPDAGNYTYTVRGLPNGKTVTGKIVVGG